jgi:hypothetical protein
MLYIVYTNTITNRFGAALLKYSYLNNERKDDYVEYINTTASDSHYKAILIGKTLSVGSNVSMHVAFIGINPSEDFANSLMTNVAGLHVSVEVFSDLTDIHERIINREIYTNIEVINNQHTELYSALCLRPNQFVIDYFSEMSIDSMYSVLLNPSIVDVTRNGKIITQYKRQMSLSIIERSFKKRISYTDSNNVIQTGCVYITTETNYTNHLASMVSMLNEMENLKHPLYIIGLMSRITPFRGKDDYVQLHHAIYVHPVYSFCKAALKPFTSAGGVMVNHTLMIETDYNPELTINNLVRAIENYFSTNYKSTNPPYNKEHLVY